jgi:hypothetical protein
MKLKDKTHVRAVLDSISRYREGQLSLEALQDIFSTTMALMEGDIPKEIRNAVQKAESWVDSIRFTVNEVDQSSKVEDVLSGFEQLISEYDDRSTNPQPTWSGDSSNNDGRIPMTWQFEHVDTIPILTNGDYALQMSVDELNKLKADTAAGGIGALRKGLDDIASRQRDPRKGRTALSEAIANDNRSQTEVLNEIRAALP